jgi:hypothetical protein
MFGLGCIVLALDQVLGDPWSSLTYFGTSGSRPFLGPFWDLGLCNGYGMLAHGLAHV